MRRVARRDATGSAHVRGSSWVHSRLRQEARTLLVANVVFFVRNVFFFGDLLLHPSIS